MRGRTAEDWRASFQATPWVSYAEALCWIIYRDVDAIAGLDVMASPRDLADMGPGTAAFMLADTEPEAWAGTNPERVLQDALEAGTVSASGKVLAREPRQQGRPPSTIISTRRQIERDEWLDLTFRDGDAPHDKGTTAYPRGAVGVDYAYIFIDVLFSRADLTTAFPGAGANQIVQLASVSTPAQGPGSLTDFIRSDARLSAARKGVVAAGEEVTKGALLRMLAQHFHDAGGRYSSPTIAGLVASMKASASRHDLTLEELNRRADRGDRIAKKG